MDNESEQLRNQLLQVIAEKQLNDVKLKCRKKVETFIIEWLKNANILIKLAATNLDIAEKSKNDTFLDEKLKQLQMKEEHLTEIDLIKRIDSTFAKLSVIDTEINKNIDINTIKSSMKKILENCLTPEEFIYIESVPIEAKILMGNKNDMEKIQTINAMCHNKIEILSIGILKEMSDDYNEINEDKDNYRRL